jgi:hypothetical protein
VHADILPEISLALLIIYGAFAQSDASGGSCAEGGSHTLHRVHISWRAMKYGRKKALRHQRRGPLKTAQEAIEPFRNRRVSDHKYSIY